VEQFVLRQLASLVRLNCATAVAVAKSVAPPSRREYTSTAKIFVSPKGWNLSKLTRRQFCGLLRHTDPLFVVNAGPRCQIRRLDHSKLKFLPELLTMIRSFVPTNISMSMLNRRGFRSPTVCRSSIRLKFAGIATNSVALDHQHPRPPQPASAHRSWREPLLDVRAHNSEPVRRYQSTGWHGDSRDEFAAARSSGAPKLGRPWLRPGIPAAEAPWSRRN
jgi:hypothetical protein